MSKDRSKNLTRRKFLYTAAGLTSSAALAACGDATATLVPATPAPATRIVTSPTEKKPLIALVQGIKGDPFYITMEKGARAKAQELGVDLIVAGPPQFDAALQAPLVDALVSRGINALLIAACDKQAMIAPLRRAYEAGVKVIITVDQFIGDGDYEKGSVTFPISYISSDNTQGGRLAGEALLKALGNKGKIYIQNVKKGISATDQREQGCKEAIDATGGAATLVGVDYNGDSAAKAAEQTAAVLLRNPDLAGIFGTNLYSAEGAAQAVKNAGKQSIIKIANFDAPEQAIRDLRAGLVDFVIAQKPGEMGTTAVEYAVKALKGDTSGLKKRVATSYVIIDKTNVDTPEAQAAIYKSN